MDPISGSAITEAIAKSANQPMIGRSTTEYHIKKDKIIVYEDQFSLRLWEIAAVALVGAAIYYTPEFLKIWDIFPEVKAPDVTGEVPTKMFFDWEAIVKGIGELPKPLEPWFPRSPEMIEPP